MVYFEKKGSFEGFEGLKKKNLKGRSLFIAWGGGGRGGFGAKQGEN